jgi:hypothetical protein
LGACVDDKESASVEKIRNAKAEQLLSIAELNKADAYAIKVLADAEAALKATEAKLKEAEAEKVKAEADLVKAEVEYRNAQTEEQKALAEKAKAEAEKAKFEAQQAEAELAVKLEGQAEKLEAALWAAKAALLTAKGTYETALDDADDAEKLRLSELLTAYTDATTSLITAKNNLVSLKRQLVQAENGLVDAEKLKEKNIIAYEIQIAYQETQKALYEKYLAVDPAEARIAYDAASLEYTALNRKANASYQEYDKTNTEYNNVNNWLDNSAYYKTLYNVFAYQSYGNMYISYNITIDKVPYFVYYVTTLGVTSPVKLFSGQSSKDTDIKYNYDDQSYGGTQSYSTIEKYYEVQTAGFNAYIAAYKEYIKENQQEAFDDAKEDYDDAVEDEADAKEDAEKADATQIEKDAYVAAHSETIAKKTTLDNAAAALDNENKILATVEEAYAFVISKEQTDAVAAKVEAYNDLSKKAAELWIQYLKENDAANLKYAEKNALQNIYNNANNIAGYISNCETQITYYERQIADLSSIETKEEAIELVKAYIEKEEARIVKYQKDYDTAKAAFEAATK